MDELITVVINVYNGEKFIKRCLESVINQTYKNLEILIINDGSTDNTLKICENYKDERIRIINQENMGLSKSRNVGIENAKGVYLYFVDADDFIECNVIEYLYKLLKESNAQIATCKSLDIYDYNYQVKNVKEKIEVISNIEMLKRLLLFDRMVVLWNKLIKKDVFNGIRFENRMINDVVVTYKLVLATEKVVCSNQIKYFYLKHEASITSNKEIKVERLIDLYNAFIERYNNIEKIYPGLIENRIRITQSIPYLYLNEIDELDEYMNQNNAMILFKKLFTWKILICPIKFSEKIKIILFRISPKLCKMIYRKYQTHNKKT